MSALARIATGTRARRRTSVLMGSLPLADSSPIVAEGSSPPQRAPTVFVPLGIESPREQGHGRALGIGDYHEAPGFDAHRGDNHAAPELLDVRDRLLAVLDRKVNAPMRQHAVHLFGQRHDPA